MREIEENCCIPNDFHHAFTSWLKIFCYSESMYETWVIHWEMSLLIFSAIIRLFINQLAVFPPYANKANVINCTGHPLWKARPNSYLTNELD